MFAGATGCRADAPQRPNLVLLLSDDQRRDTIGRLGNTAIATPNLDRIAWAGMTFSRSRSPFNVSRRPGVLVQKHRRSAGGRLGRLDRALRLGPD
jgi:hypothetical protein